MEWDADGAPVIALARLKDSLRITHDDLDDLIHTEHLPAAVRWAEAFMHRSILAKTHRWIIDAFPPLAFRLPRGKTQSVTSIAYVKGGATTTLTGPTSGSPMGTDYQEDLRGDLGGIIMPNRGTSWPTVDDDVPAPILITFSAGWTAKTIPQGVTSALMLLVRDLFEGTDHKMQAQALLSPFRISR